MQLIQRVYVSPKLWYMRVSIIEAQHIMPGHRGLEVVRFPEFSTKVQVGNQTRSTAKAAPSDTRSFSNPYWNKELVFVVTEPFEEHLLVSVEDRVGPEKEEVVATMLIPMARIDEGPITSRWFNLDSHFGNAGDNHKLITSVVSRIRMRILFDEGYDVLDEGTLHRSDYIGVLEMRVLGATGLTPMKIDDSRSVSDAYCVAKYGRELVRTHIVVDSLSPKWNAQYKWEVHDPCSVLTIGVFYDCRINENSTKNTVARDYPIGKVRIRLSTIETDRAYTDSYPLLRLDSTGVQEMGELQLFLRFSCTNMANMLLKYTMPLPPYINYTRPLSAGEALQTLASKLSTEEPPLSSVVLEYMYDWHMSSYDSHMWSIRRSKANFNRLLSLQQSLIYISSGLVAIRNWKYPGRSALFLIIFSTLVMLPALIIPTILLSMAFVGLWNYRFRPRHPPQIDTSVSHADVLADEFREEFDTFPIRASDIIVRMRYDKLRTLAGRLQTIVGEVATTGERIHAVLSWRDPRATFLFVVLFLVAAVGFCVVPFRLVVALLVLYSMRPPEYRSKLPSLVGRLFERLPAKVDSMLFTGEEKGYVCHDTENVLAVSILEGLQQFC